MLHPKAGTDGWKIGCEEKLELTDFNTDMVGLCTGPYNELYIFDLDNVEIFQQVAKYFALPLPETTLVKTGRGFHYYYHYPDDGVGYTSRSLKYLGFDILTSKKYIVAMGSSHPNGNYYKLIKCINPFITPPDWLKLLSSKSCHFNFLLTQLNRIRHSEVNFARKKELPIPEFDLDNLVEKFLIKYPNYEQFMCQFPGYKKSLENSMSQNHNSYNPFEQPQKPSLELPETTQDLLNINPPVGQRSEPIMSAMIALKNTGLSDEQVEQIMLSSPLGEKLRQKGTQFMNREIASANNFIQANPPKKQKINIQAETYTIMSQQYYVKGTDGELYCKIIQVNNRIEYSNVKSESFYGTICKILLARFKKTISLAQFKPILTALIEDKKLTAPTVPSVRRFYQDKNKIIYDLGRDDYQCIEISTEVKPIPHPEMILERSELTLPVNDVDITPKGIDNMELLWNLCEINTIHQRHFLNIVILSYLFNNVNSPLLYLYGHHGSGKTHLAIAIKGIFDPLPEGTVLPNKIESLRLFLNQSGIGFIDNFSELKPDILNDLCMSYSGGIVFNRQLFQDKKGIKYSIRCPMILASIKIPTKLPEDFISRTAFIKVHQKNKRIPEMELKDELNKLYPKIRGEMFNLASQVLPLLNNYKPTDLTRHADFDLIGQAYCDICKCPLSYIQIIQQINTDSAFSVIDDEPSIRNFIKIVSEYKFITFTMSEMTKIMAEDTNINYIIHESRLGRDLKDYAMILEQLHIKLYSGEKLSSGAKPYVAFLDDDKSIPEDIDPTKLRELPKYVTEIYLRYHKTEIGMVIDDLMNNI